MNILIYTTTCFCTVVHSKWSRENHNYISYEAMQFSIVKRQFPGGFWTVLAERRLSHHAIVP